MQVSLRFLNIFRVLKKVASCWIWIICYLFKIFKKIMFKKRRGTCRADISHRLILYSLYHNYFFLHTKKIKNNINPFFFTSAFYTSCVRRCRRLRTSASGPASASSSAWTSTASCWAAAYWAAASSATSWNSNSDLNTANQTQNASAVVTFFYSGDRAWIEDNQKSGENGFSLLFFLYLSKDTGRHAHIFKNDNFPKAR